MDFPGARFQSPVICSHSPESFGSSQRTITSVASGASSAWPAANRAIYVPFALAAPYGVQRVWWVNGTTANVNVDCGVYTVGGTRLGAIGSTAQSGTSVLQSAALALYLLPGSYYMALLLSATTGHTFRTSPAVANQQLLGMAQQAVGATALPATATFAAVASAYLPLFGITSRTVI